ncbi:Chaperone protein dnaJ [Coemansia sp. BCRC 34301]|nr:Chaperone protein dnaJ [Coemansia sp. BCRC 34301]
MEVNRDEAARALSIAQQKWAAGDTASALRLARRSHSLYPTPESTKCVNAYSQGAPVDSTKEKSPPQRTHTPQQLSSVRGVMAAKNDYYKILGVDRAASLPDLKRAYRKSALLFHPDKNCAPGADEAFKLVANAFTVLSDSEKRAHYDRFGVTRKPVDNHHHHVPGMRQRNEDLSPEDLFNMFFADGRFGVQFGPNVRFAQNHRTHRRQEEDQSLWSACMQFVPLVVLVLTFFGSSILSVLMGASSLPGYAFEAVAPYTMQRHTAVRRVEYWVDPKEVPESFGNLRRFEYDVEAQYVSRLQIKCRQQKEAKRMAVHQAQGWFGIGDDRVRLQAAYDMPLPACDELKRFR